MIPGPQIQQTNGLREGAPGSLRPDPTQRALAAGAPCGGGRGGAVLSRPSARRVESRCRPQPSTSATPLQGVHLGRRPSPAPLLILTDDFVKSTGSPHTVLVYSGATAAAMTSSCARAAKALPGTGRAGPPGCACPARPMARARRL